MTSSTEQSPSGVTQLIVVARSDGDDELGVDREKQLNDVTTGSS